MKDDYRTVYFNLHKKARLGINEDDKKKELLKDPRLESLKKLARRVAVAARNPDRSTDPLGETSAVLHTGQGRPERRRRFVPTAISGLRKRTWGPAVTAVLQQIDQQIDGMLENWRKTLLENLDDPTAKKSIKLLPDGQKRPSMLFLKAKTLPEKISNDLVQGMQTALSGLIAIPSSSD